MRRNNQQPKLALSLSLYHFGPPLAHFSHIHRLGWSLYIFALDIIIESSSASTVKFHAKIIKLKFFWKQRVENIKNNRMYVKVRACEWNVQCTRVLFLWPCPTKWIAHDARWYGSTSLWVSIYYIYTHKSSFASPILLLPGWLECLTSSRRKFIQCGTHERGTPPTAIALRGSTTRSSSNNTTSISKKWNGYARRQPQMIEKYRAIERKRERTRSKPTFANRLTGNSNFNKYQWKQGEWRSHVDLIIMIIKFIDYLSCFVRTDLNISRQFLACEFSAHFFCFHTFFFIGSMLLCRSREISFLYWKLCLLSLSLVHTHVYSLTALDLSVWFSFSTFNSLLSSVFIHPSISLWALAVCVIVRCEDEVCLHYETHIRSNRNHVGSFCETDANINRNYNNQSTTSLMKTILWSHSNNETYQENIIKFVLRTTKYNAEETEI